MSGYFNAAGKHICPYCDSPTKYQILSGGEEWWCETCEFQGRYPEGEGGPRARMLRSKDGQLRLRRMMYEELMRRKRDKEVSDGYP